MNRFIFPAQLIFLNLLVLLSPFNVFSQPAPDPEIEITGVWGGYIETSEKNLPYEIAITKLNGQLSGYSYTTFSVKGEEQVVVKSLRFKKEKGNIIIEDDSLIYDNFDEDAPRELKQISTLSLKAEGPVITMTGKFKTKKTSKFRILTGAIRLRKDSLPDVAKLLPKLDQLNLSNSLSFLHPEQVAPPVIAVVKPVIPVPDTVLVNEVSPKLELSYNSFQPRASSPSLDRFMVNPRRRPAKRIIFPAMAPLNVPEPEVAAVPVKKNVPVAAKAPVKTTVVAAAAIAQAPAKALPPPVRPKPVLTVALPSVNLSNRSIETIQTVYFKSDSLQLTLYDNGEVDGDSVSVILNGSVILSKQGLSTNAINKTIYVTPEMGDSLQMIMYAENLGTIPPNTGLLIVLDGKDRYEIRFAGDLNKNAAIIFRKRRG